MKTQAELYQDIQTILANGWEQAAISALEQLAATHPTFGQAHYDLAVLFHKTGQPDKSLNHFKKAVECEPENAGFLKSLADFYFGAQENAEEALLVYKRFLEKQPEDSEVLFVAGNLSVVLHQFDEAVDYYQRLLKIEPWHTDALESLDKIKRHLEEKVQKNPEELYGRAQELVAAQDLKTAVAVLEELIALDSGYEKAYNDLGVLYHRLEDNDRALTHYRRAVELDPYNRTFQKNLADFLLVEKGQVAEALEIYLELMKTDPEDIEVLLAAGHICQRLNKPEDALTFFYRAIEIEPWNQEASNLLQQLQDEMRAKSAAGF
jgi:tetratricopeptide (TPR) repeat protein